MYEELVGGKEALDLYETNKKIPRKSKFDDGGWIKFEDICNKFNKLIIIQNTKLCYKENLYVDNVWHNYKTDEYHPSEDNMIFLFVKALVEGIQNDDFDDNINKNEANNKKKQIKKKEKNKKVVEEEKNESENNDNLFELNNSPYCSILIIFEPINEQYKLNEEITEVIYPYISLDLIEKESNLPIAKNVILNKF